jgi:hypothetical protein
MPALPYGPISGRFTRTHQGYVHPARLDAWERSMIESVPMARPPRGPGGSISGSDDGWDDYDE